MNDSSKTLALVVSAIKNLREIKGSTTREILRYLCSVYNIPVQVARRQMQAVLKRGVAYGIFKNNGGHYVLPLSYDSKGKEIASQELNLLDICRKKRSRNLACKCKKKRRRRRRKRSMKSCKCKKRRSRSRSGRKRRRRMSGGCRRRSRRSRGCKRRTRRRSMSCRRRRRKKCRCGGLGNKDDQNRMKKAETQRAAQDLTDDKAFDVLAKNDDSEYSECNSVSTISSAAE
ncbi:uncharacterized protein LOC117222952 [Megalopta genalis]|uniref:uncharacterized protein LOC117222952 n=1 Tax=Megalopta genalis TaxID=115081 RepID=UPI001443511C|nr:peptidyl-prolyl cis-trans isomerase 1-like [Megalopta genalis]